MLKACTGMPVKCHIGDAMVVDKCPSNDEAVEKLMRMEKDVHFAREESLGYSERQETIVTVLILLMKIL